MRPLIAALTLALAACTAADPHTAAALRERGQLAVTPGERPGTYRATLKGVWDHTGIWDMRRPEDRIAVLRNATGCQRLRIDEERQRRLPPELIDSAPVQFEIWATCPAEG
ncbi:hypothetical protein [Elioraea sp.]|uniref:hypothetical protein n=1 Tax=Elioraea sp. TaxID=2185103 RepID=UPI0025B95BE8|nr:hypothetical protein [Elioraea sp.]